MVAFCLVFFSTPPGEGWAECKVRPPCTEKDYFQIHTACDGEGKVRPPGQRFFTDPPPSTTSEGWVLFCFFCPLPQTQVLYRWVEPKICVENATGAVALPAEGRREPCPPCNPGYHNSNDSACLPCPPGTHSDGTNGNGYRGNTPARLGVVRGGLIFVAVPLGAGARPRMHPVWCGHGAVAGLRV